MNIVEAIRDPNTLGATFPESTWGPWITALKAAFALPMTDQEFAFYQKCTGRSRPMEAPAKEVFFLCGRRAGKGRVTAAIATYLAAFQDHSKVLAPGEKGLLPIIASDREQALIVLNYIREIFLASPILSQMVEKSDLTWEIPLKNRAEIRVMTASRAAIRGYTSLGTILEEVAVWPSEGARQDYEIFRAEKPGRLTTGGPRIVITTVYRRRGVVYDSWKKFYGQDDGRVLVWVAKSEWMNSMLDPAEIEAERLADPEAAAAEYDCVFRSDVEDFLPYEVLEPCVVANRRELAPQPNIRYFAFTDPSGGRQDSFTLALAHRKADGVVLDVIRRRVPPFNPGEVVAEFAQVLKEYRCTEVKGDRYSAEWVVSAFREHGIVYRNSERDRSQIYQEALPLFTRGEAELLDDRVLLAELAGLERKVRPLGKDMVTHGPGGKDDAANSACGALVLAKGAIKRQAGLLFPRRERDKSLWR